MQFPGSDLPALERRAARWNIFVAFVILFGTIGIPAMMIPVLLGPIQDDTGWTRADVSAVNSVKFAVGAFTAFFTGHIVERLGVRWVGTVCTIMAGCALLLFATVQSLTLYYVVGMLLGVSALGTATSMKIFVSQWFTKGQGIAVGLAFMGLSMAGVIIPYITTLLVETYGWRTTVMVMSLGIWLGALPAFLWRATNHVEPAASKPTDNSEPPSKAAFRKIRFAPAFIALLASNFLIGMVDEAMATHLVIFFDREVKLGASVAAIGFSLVMVMSNVGKIGFGWLIERYSNKGAAICWMIAAVGVLLAMPISGLASLVLFAIVYGPTQGGFLVNVPVLSKQLFGPVAMIRTIAVLTTIFNIGAAVGPWLVGYIYDQTGNYQIPFIMLSVSAVIAAILMLFARTSYHTEAQPSA